MLSRTRIGTLAAVAAATLTLGVGTAASAVPDSGARPADAPTVAQSNPYTPQEVCGGDYYVQESEDLPGATVYLLYNGSSNCVTTIKSSSVGTPTLTNACLQVQGMNSWKCDKGKFEYYAGPVKKSAAGKCVRFFGYHGGDNYTSDWVHCG